MLEPGELRRGEVRSVYVGMMKGFVEGRRQVERRGKRRSKGEVCVGQGKDSLRKLGKEREGRMEEGKEDDEGKGRMEEGKEEEKRGEFCRSTYFEVTTRVGGKMRKDFFLEK